MERIEKRAQIAPIAPTLGGVFVYLVQCTYNIKLKMASVVKGSEFV